MRRDEKTQNVVKVKEAVIVSSELDTNPLLGYETPEGYEDCTALQLIKNREGSHI